MRGATATPPFLCTKPSQLLLLYVRRRRNSSFLVCGAVAAPPSLCAAPLQLLLPYVRRRRSSSFLMLRQRHSMRLQWCAKAATTFAEVLKGGGEHERRIRVFFGPRHGSRKLMDCSIQPLDHWIAPIQRGSDPTSDPTRFCLKGS